MALYMYTVAGDCPDNEELARRVQNGDKNAADGAAVLAMRHVLNEINIRGEIVIGEGEIDEAPMLYIGERVGTGFGDDVDIAVDPIEGTRMTAMGQANAMTTLAVGEKGSFLKAPDMYMEKLIVGPKAKGVIDLNLSLEENIHRVAKAINKPLSAVTVMTLAKPRHDEQIKQMQALGVRVFAIPDGDVAASILTCMPFSEVDMVYGIGGAPEGVVSAAVIRALDGDMQGRLVLRKDVKGETEENIRMSKDEARRCDEMGVKPGQILKLEDMAKSDNVMFSATGITKTKCSFVFDSVTRVLKTLLFSSPSVSAIFTPSVSSGEYSNGVYSIFALSSIRITLVFNIYKTLRGKFIFRRKVRHQPFYSMRQKRFPYLPCM